MQDKRLIWLALAGLMICLFLNSGCAYREDDARRELVVIGGDELIYALNPLDGTLFELGEDELKTGWYREMKWEPPSDVTYYPVAMIDEGESLRLYGTSPEGAREFRVIAGEEEISLETRKLNMSEGDILLAVDGDDLVLANDAGLRVIENGVDYLFEKPDGDFSKPVVTRRDSGEWIAVWPDRIEEEKPERGRSWTELSMGGPGRMGTFIVQVISSGSEVTEYRLENKSYNQTRAKGLIGILSDADDRLLILDDKGYITIYDGEQSVMHFYAGINPSRYAMNSLSWGPGGHLLVTDAVGRMVNMYDIKTGERIYSWRLPIKRKEFTASAGVFTCVIDILLLTVVIFLVIRILGRVRRYQVYREDGEKR